MNYKIVDLNQWERGELFQFYIDKMRIVMSLTVDVDVAPLAAFAKKSGLKFYPLMIWVVSKVVNSHEEFKYSCCLLYTSSGRERQEDCDPF